MERKHWNKSRLLSKILDHAVLGTQEVLDIRRRSVLIWDYLSPPQIHRLVTGSVGEGFHVEHPDTDLMIIMSDVAVLYSETYPDVAENILKKTVFFLRETNCQPGYVALQLAIPGKNMTDDIQAACVPCRNSIFISSDIFRQHKVDELTRVYGFPFQSNGPCASTMNEIVGYCDYCVSFPCLNWPHEALAWISRVRLYGWPSHASINEIVQGGCHVVPVGDKCSEDTFLQWRLSFVKAERHLVYSLNHLQMKVYTLMKELLKQIRDLLRSLIKEDDILCSYFVKTIIFYAVENSPPSLWQESHIFTCFQFCLSILIDWVRSAYCPHYFVPQNNLFLRKVCSQNKEKLLQVLLEVQGKKWRCLSDMNFKDSFCIGNILQSLIRGETRYMNYIHPSLEYLEFMKDRSLYMSLTFHRIPVLVELTLINKVMSALLKSQTDEDEYVLYRILLECLAKVAKDTYARNTTSGGNKQTYKDLKKCKQLLAPLASLCRNPGKLYLATFHYLVGNYNEVLNVCKVMHSPSRLFADLSDINNAQNYINTFCGKGYSWFKKCDVFGYALFVEKELCPHELLLEARRTDPLSLPIPALLYALFLTFLCHYHLGDTRRCKETLVSLEAMFCCNKDTYGMPKYWIVYSLLGICFQYVGKYRKAIEFFGTSLDVGPVNNPAKERMAIIYLLMCDQNLKLS